MIFDKADGPVEQLLADTRKRAEQLLPLESGTLRRQWRSLAGLGLLRMAPVDSTAIGPITRKLAMVEGLGSSGVSAGLCYAMTSQLFGMQLPLQPWLSQPQQKLMAGLESGALLMCHALTEANGGSDPMSMSTQALRQSDGSYRLSGEKCFITAAPEADLALVFARTGKGRSPFDLSAFLFDLSAKGVSRSAPVPKTALPDVPMGMLNFDAVHLSEASLVGGEGAGFSVLTATTSWERALLLGYALGPMRAMLEQAIAWSNSRSHFGRPMGASHLVAAHVADMTVALYRSRQLLYGIAAKLDAGVPIRQLSTDASLIKISVTEDFVNLSRLAAMLGGVRSYIGDSGQAIDLISPMAGMTYAGVNDLLRIGIARQLGLPVEN